MPAPDINPPVIAESGDPFGALRVIDLVARLPRGREVPLAAIVDRLNATYLDWLFEPRVVADALVQLQVNWMADYRNSSGIVLEDGPAGATLTIEDSSRVDPWIVRQAERLASACSAILDEFSRGSGGPARTSLGRCRPGAIGRVAHRAKHLARPNLAATELLHVCRIRGLEQPVRRALAARPSAVSTMRYDRPSVGWGAGERDRGVRSHGAGP